MSLPRWNPRWDRHETRGGPGWSPRRYVNLLAGILLAAVFGCVFLGVWASAAARAKRQRQLLEIVNKLHDDAVEQKVADELRGEK